MGTVPPILFSYDFRTVFGLSQFWFVFIGKGNVTNESSQVIHFNKLFDPVTLEPKENVVAMSQGSYFKQP